MVTNGKTWTTNASHPDRLYVFAWFQVHPGDCEDGHQPATGVAISYPHPSKHYSHRI